MSVRHTDDKTCPYCEDMLRQADPRLTAWFRGVKAKYPSAHVFCSYRGEIEQNRAYREGKSKLTYPHSKHNAIRNGKPCSLALDIFQIDDDGIGRYQRPFYAKVAREAREANEPITWGGDWNGNGVQDKSDWDAVHFEIKEGPA